jgi:hypothetical protein
MNCDFCFQSHHNDIDVEAIKNIPKLLEDNYPERLKNEEVKNVSISIKGGELFSDDIPDTIFSLYEEVCKNIIILIRKYLPDIKIKFTWITNGVYTKYDRVLRLFNNINNENEKCVIIFNYNYIGRFITKEQFELFENTLMYFYNNYKILPKINYLALKSNMDTFISGDDKFLLSLPNDIIINIHHYYNNRDNFNHTFLNINNVLEKSNDKLDLYCPGDEDFYQFYKYIIDNDRYNFNRVDTIIKYIYNLESVDFFFTCRELLNHLSKKELQKKYCIPGIEKRGCLYCEYNNICDEMCWCFIHFDFFKMSECYIKRTIRYLYEHPEIKDRYNEFKRKIDYDKFID